MAMGVGLFQASEPTVQRSAAGHSTSRRTRAGAAQEAHICFVIRTYWGHGPRGSGSLHRMLQWLHASPYKRWSALLMVMDDSPFHELPGMVAGLKDPRVSIFAQQEGAEYAARLPSGGWRPHYHQRLYNLTDAAMAGCDTLTQWVLPTNGDNEYDARLLPRLSAVPPAVGLVALDYYSRYQRPTARPCERFAAGASFPSCKANGVRFCNTDLAANVINWRRWRSEGRSFGMLTDDDLGLNDGMMAEALVRDGWEVHHITDRCLLSHSPSPQLCALNSGVWDDSSYDSFEGGGGRCVSLAEGRAMMDEDGGGELELTHVQLSSDGLSAIDVDSSSQPSS
ncbi:MAG: hypothetical protein WDW36_010166 [Sanguina aurantia]